MQKPTLVIMAAGLGSRFGGLKQLAAVDDFGASIIDFSLFDAKRAGFERVAFIIKREIEAEFRKTVGAKAEKNFEVSYVFQELSALPTGFEIPEGRVKPWGTGHAVLCCLGTVTGPFAVINADDFYGKSAYAEIFSFLSSPHAANEHAMVGYALRHTLTENGFVSRGVCETQDGFLSGITERTHIEKRGDAAAFTEDGENFLPLTGSEIVSMNFWGFGSDMLTQLERRFPQFLQSELPKNPEKCEFFLPSAASAALHENLATVRVLECDAQWHGITYREDLQTVKTAIQKMKLDGSYPERL